MSQRPEEENREPPYYFTQKDLLHRYPDLLPSNSSWPEMMERKEIFSPKILFAILQQAKEFLMNEPGLYKTDRQNLAPLWFDYWEELIKEKIGQREKAKSNFVQGLHLIQFNKVKSFLEGEGRDGGVLFVAGAEGHYGHVQAAKFMKMLVDTVVWAFEQDSYISAKDRRAPFLPLPVRLSMWDYFGIDIVTVSPEKDVNIPVNDHYKSLFDNLGAKYCFATEDDPNLDLKIQRGELALFLVIPKVRVETTTDRVQKLFPRLEIPNFGVDVKGNLFFQS